MEKKTLKQFHRDLSWSTRIYTLMCLFVIGFAFLTDAWESNWVKTILMASLAILLFESFAIYFHKHPRIWKNIRWMLILIFLSLLLMGIG